ncbi:AMP-binding protein [Actinokineospora fastidiosa]|uniref:Long-chain acyl-CoA synthetase n=1 Tax=Actinokineospora fastidiosa TaxID=1816 RepID=A0A918L8X3_9PSEU|nr:AMP-binding protein [Actinokineospora fastidiosa]GGS22134.1 long-chain acyl-CoA synthetase [Actinokineospora fastidiosa]
MDGLPTGNLADPVAEASAKVPLHAALIDASASVSLTWRQVDAAVDACARGLLDAGLRPGDRVALRLPTGAAFAVAVFGILRAGGVAVPIGTDAAPRELERLIAHSGATLGFGDLPGVTVLDHALGSADPVEPVEPIGGGEDLAVIAYTSGTGGEPRGAMLSHRALLANAAQLARLRPAPVTATDRVLLSIPMSHAYGLSGLWQVAATGATAVLVDRFAVDPVLELCERHRVTVFIGVPAMYTALTAAGADRLGEALATLRLCTSGAAPLDARTLALFRAETGLSVFEGYGLTETGPVLTSTLVGGLAKPGSVGRPIPGVRIRLVDSDGTPIGGAPDDESIAVDYADDADTGLVAAQGPNLFSGYWPDGAHGPDAEGWFRTGDVGYLDADGDLHLVDRAGDLIIVNGFNVYPHEVEQVVAELPSVAEVAAVGVPDERAGERVKVVVVPRPGEAVDEDAVRAHCAERLARFKVPAVVEFAEGLPHSVTGKLRRAGLRG